MTDVCSSIRAWSPDDRLRPLLTNLIGSDDAKTKFDELMQASRAAVLAAAQESKQLTTLELDQLRYHARIWLRMAVDHVAGRETLPKQLADLLEDSDFATVREERQLAILSSQERDGWNEIWTDVRQLSRTR